LVYLIVGVFLAGLMVGRTPEYLGKKVEAREMKLAMLALLVHPILILGPTGLFAALDWGTKSTNNPGPHGFSNPLRVQLGVGQQRLRLRGTCGHLGVNNPADNNSPPAPYSPHWDIATGLVMLLGRFIPIVAPLALAGSLAAKKPTPFTVGTMPPIRSLRLRAPGHDPAGRRAVVPAAAVLGRWRNTWADTVWRMNGAVNMTITAGNQPRRSCPVGTTENSPAIHRWVQSSTKRWQSRRDD